MLRLFTERLQETGKNQVCMSIIPKKLVLILLLFEKVQVKKHILILILKYVLVIVLSTGDTDKRGAVAPFQTPIVYRETSCN